MTIWENIKNIKLLLTEKRKNYLVSESNFHTTKIFTENILAIEMKTTEILMSKRVYLVLSILELSKILTYEFWYGYVKQKIGEKQSCVTWIQIASLYT